MRPITNGTGSGPHTLASMLINFLTNLLPISGSHLENSTDLINRHKDGRVINWKLSGFDVASLFTKVPTNEALTTARRTLTKKPNLSSPISNSRSQLTPL